jgi:hypothetical protein
MWLVEQHLGARGGGGGHVRRHVLGPATLAHHVNQSAMNPCSLRYVTSYDVAGNICQALARDIIGTRFEPSRHMSMTSCDTLSRAMKILRILRICDYS